MRCGAVCVVFLSANRTVSCNAMWCGALLLAVRCTVTCGAVWLCHFAGGFGAVYAVW